MATMSFEDELRKTHARGVLAPSKMRPCRCPICQPKLHKEIR